MNPRMHLLAANRPSPQLVYNRAYACHQSVMSATDGKAALWVDLAGQTKPPLLRILTSTPIQPPSGWELQGANDYRIETIDIGETLRFRIRFNPTVKRDGKRFAVWSGRDINRERAAEEWLVGRSQRHGFQLLESNVEDLDWVEIKRRNRAIKFARATMTGRLRVTDQASFKEALMSGIGPQKAFGCGLLLIKRAGQGEN